MRARIVAALGMLVAGCGLYVDDNDGPDATERRDARPQADAPPIDAPTDARIPVDIACATDSCSGPDEVCCDRFSAPDTCEPSFQACDGLPMTCDGPEDCGVFQDCCLFEGQGSRCVDDNFCGFTGAISNPMCHTAADCVSFGSFCCPNPANPAWMICSFSTCPS
jgi:hypothetical protein